MARGRMGQETRQTRYTEEHEKEFLRRLQRETALLCQRIKAGDFSSSPLTCGYEAEGWIIDSRALPLACSHRLLESLADPRITPELSKCNFEINGNPFPVDQNLNRALERDFRFYREKCHKAARSENARIMFIGTYPDLTKIPFGMGQIYPRKRYHAINRRIHALRGGPARINIRGKDLLQVETSNIMLEAGTTSLQIHLQTGFSEARDFYNAALLASPVMCALSANSPYVLGKELWDESRIPLFEQVISLKAEHEGRPLPRAGLGAGFVRESVSELFEQNLSHPVLLPELADRGDEGEKLRHLLFHNGTIWRWNRPLIGFDKQGRWHFRIEHRVPSSGPSLIDMRANIFFFIGLLYALKKQVAKEGISLPFHDLEKSFYQAARRGLAAEISWPGSGEGKIRDLILLKLLPRVWEELKQLPLAGSETDRLINHVIKGRAESGRTGAFWQKAYIQKFGRRFDKMAEACWQNQERDLPVCQWRV